MTRRKTQLHTCRKINYCLIRLTKSISRYHSSKRVSWTKRNYIYFPSNASDAKGLLKYACRCDDPVLFMEHKGIYRQGFASSMEPDENYLLPFGKARIVQEGSDLTIVTWGAIVQKAVEASRNTGKSV